MKKKAKRFSILPRTRLGILTIGLIIVFFLMFFLLQLLIALGEIGGETFFSNMKLAITLIIGAASGILAFFTGLISIIKYRERALIVFLATLIGLFVLFFVSGEFLSPH